MKALLLTKVGSPYELSLEEVAVPVPGAGEVRIKVAYSSINPVDFKFAKGGSSLTLPHVLGIDAAGVVDAVGPGVSAWKAGDRVIALSNLLRWGGFAEYVVVSQDIISAIPAHLTFDAAATIPCAGITAWQAVYRKAHLEAGQSVLVNAGGGAVGGFVIQLAKALGATVYATASSEPERLRKLGADAVINYKTENVVERVMALSGGRGVDAVIDMVSGPASAALLPLLRHNGHIVCVVGRPSDATLPPWGKAISIHDVALGFAYQHGDSENLRDIARGGEFLAKRMADGELDPMISQVILLEDAPDALRAAEAGQNQGKVVIRIADLT